MKRTIATLCSLVSMAPPVTGEAILDCAGYHGPCTVTSAGISDTSHLFVSPYKDHYLKRSITVEKGDTLIGLAERECGDRKAYLRIACRNKIEAPYRIYAGQDLRLACGY
ncbi:MAG: hypothetical protein AABX13_03705 [Nanoarchaeota archaeon]